MSEVKRIQLSIDAELADARAKGKIGKAVFICKRNGNYFTGFSPALYPTYTSTSLADTVLVDRDMLAQVMNPVGYYPEKFTPDHVYRVVLEELKLDQVDIVLNK